MSIALKAALIATSVLPNPTSPQINRSIGFSDSISVFTSAVALIWSFVSTYKNEASSSFCIELSILYLYPLEIFLFAYDFIKSKASFFILVFALVFNLSQAPDPSLKILGFAPSLLLYFEIL